jgi:hypothetical protein
MLGKTYARLSVLALVIAALVAVAAIAEAVRSNSLGPIWTVGWLPAVLVSAVRPRPSTARCSVRHRRRARR